LNQHTNKEKKNLRPRKKNGSRTKDGADFWKIVQKLKRQNEEDEARRMVEHMS
jgi:hypothetical protein